MYAGNDLLSQQLVDKNSIIQILNFNINQFAKYMKIFIENVRKRTVKKTALTTKKCIKNNK